MNLIERLQASPDASRLAGHLKWFAQVRRDSGGPGEEQAADYIRRTLESAGVPVQMHRFKAFLSYPRSASLQVDGAGGFKPACVTHSFAKSTPPEGISGRVTHVRDGDFSSAAGKIVLVDGLCTPITVLEASRAGVRALIFANEGEVPHNMIATTVWGTPEADQLERLPRVSAVSLSRPAAEDLKQLLAAGDPEVRIHAQVETGWYDSLLPEVRISGSGPDAGQFVLAGAHYCSWEYGITDNATGDACLLEMAIALHRNQHDLNRSVRLCWWPGHSHGRYSGSTWYADTFFSEISDGCIAYHNIDSPGVRNATHYVARHTTAEIEQFCSQLITDLTGQKDPPVHRPSRAADQSFLANGVASYSTYPFLPEDHPDRKPWTGGSANAWWWHSSEDTLDKADTDILVLDTRISLTGIARLANAELLPLNPVRLIEEAGGFAADLAAATVGILDTAELQAAAAELTEAAAVFSDFLQSAQSAVERQQVNTVSLKLSRLLTPLAYSKSGRFTHDPAELSPILRNNRSLLYPGLSAGFELAGQAGSEAGFVSAGLVRQLNRTTATWREASALCRTLLPVEPMQE